jgi:hypothetical protein
MMELLQFAWGALRLKQDAFTRHVQRDNVLQRGVLILIVATLIGGLTAFAMSLVGYVNPQRQLQAIEEGMDAYQERFLGPYFSMLESMGGEEIPPELMEMMEETMDAQLGLIKEVVLLPTPLPRPVSGTLQALGEWLATPFARLAGWLSYALWVMLAAKLLGGRGTAAQMLGATAAFAIPHVLDILTPVPYVGFIFGFVATLWGLAIYAKGLAVANDMGYGKALVAMLLPAVVGIILAIVGAMVLGLLIFMAAAGA